MATILDPDGDALLDPDGEPITIGPGYPDLVLALNPVFYYRVGETGSDNPADSSPSGYGSALGAEGGAYSWDQPGAIAGDPDTALGLSGGASFQIRLSGSGVRVALTADQTRLAWVQTTATDAPPGYEGDAALSVIGDSSGLVWDGFGITDGFVRYNRVATSTWEHFPGATAVNDGNWHMIAATYDSSTREVVLYVDGEVDGGGTVSSHNAQGGITHVGRGYDDADFFDGVLDEVAAFDTVLSTTDISALWDAASGTEPAIPPTVDPGHLLVHGGILAVPVPPTIDTGHLAVHGGMLAVVQPVSIPAGHLNVHAGILTIATPIALAGAIRGPVAYGPRISTSDIPPALVVRLYHGTDLNTEVAELTDSYGRRWQDPLNEAGSASVVLQNDDPALDLVTDGDVLRFELHGWAAFCCLIRERDQVTVAAGEEAAQATTLSGPGTLAVLDGAVVYPARGLHSKPVEEDRLFSWVSVDYDDSAWTTPIEIAYVLDDTPAWYGIADHWPDVVTRWIWAPGGTVRLAPGGTCYFRRTFTLDRDMRVVVYFASDDIGDLWLDGTLVKTGNQWTNTASDVQTVEVDLTAGPHLIAINVANSAEPADIDGPFNPAAVACSVHEIDPVGTVNPAAIVYTDATWRMVAYPPNPPGMTPGEVIRHVVQEAQARGALLGLTFNFTDEVDAEGVAWPEVTDISTRVGTDLLTFLREMTGTYVDIWLEPAGWRLWAWVRDGRGTDADVVLAPADPLDPTTGNLVALSHKKA